jgi:hypothetical protein
MARKKVLHKINCIYLRSEQHTSMPLVIINGILFVSVNYS